MSELTEQYQRLRTLNPGVVERPTMKTLGTGMSRAAELRQEIRQRKEARERGEAQRLAARSAPAPRRPTRAVDFRALFELLAFESAFGPPPKPSNRAGRTS